MKEFTKIKQFPFSLPNFTNAFLPCAILGTLESLGRSWQFVLYIYIYIYIYIFIFI